jgi:hypothetical protein
MGENGCESSKGVTGRGATGSVALCDENEDFEATSMGENGCERSKGVTGREWIGSVGPLDENEDLEANSMGENGCESSKGITGQDGHSAESLVGNVDFKTPRDNAGG